MNRRLRKIAIGILVFVLASTILLFILSRKEKPDTIVYGMSFNTLYARELGLDWKLTYNAILNELGVRHLRLAAHWPMIEPVKDNFNFSELDYQINKAEEYGAEVILAVGRRLPRWPECHVPSWAEGLTEEARQAEILDYITAVVERYKDREIVKIWQVENEPFLEVFAFEHCGKLNEDFLEKEVDLVKKLDANRPVLVTDSGNLGTWSGAYRHGDMFGTSVYVHFWNPELGQFRTVLPPWFYRLKDNLMAIRYGDKPTILIELSAEPWLLEPIVEVDIETQYSRMDIDKFEDILTYADKTHFAYQYLWGAEWWYWLHLQGHSEMWIRGTELYPDSQFGQ
ncbi:beta-galactosidase [Candidatus Kaiserbacteria bacterium]|nr:beta-galactosidase [Candidatus Kaiserbacteria bacterium]